MFKLNPTGLFLLAGARIPAGGTWGFTVPIPNAGVLRGIRVYFQALEGPNVAAGRAAFTDVVSIVLR